MQTTTPQYSIRRPQTADRRPQTADRRPQTADRRPQTADRRPQTADRNIKTDKSEVGGLEPNNQQLTTNSSTVFLLIIFLLLSFVSFSQRTHIPDANFRKALLENHNIRADGSNTILNADAIAIDSLNVSNNYSTPDSERISNLAGIEAFTALTYLNCRHNLLTSLNVSANTDLTNLNCGDNQLTSLNVSANTALTFLVCWENQLTSLNVSANTALTELYCRHNLLTSLDVSANTALTVLNCWENQLTELNVSANTALTTLWCSNNQLTELNISANMALNLLSCQFNQLTELNVSANMALATLYCMENQLTSLNVSANTVLTNLSCGDNQLTSLNVKNGNNYNFTRSFGDNRIANSFKATGNPNLICIQVDDLAYSTANWPNKSAIASYSEDCSNFVLSTTAIPDPNFERALITLGYDSGEIDGEVYTDNISGITSLDVSKNFNTPDSERISNLAGIEDFTALTRLECHNNKLTSLDVSANTALATLICNFNQLTSLDVSANTDLTLLYCRNNQLTSLNVSANTALTGLDCRNNQLTSLNVSTNTALTDLNCGSNQLTSLNVSANTALTWLGCWENQLTSIDVSANTALTGLSFGGNQLMSLDVSTNTALTFLNCRNNQLTSLNVSANTALTYLYCYSNQLTSLDVSANTALTTLLCDNNQLTSLNVKNGNNNNFTRSFGDNRIANSFKATSNPNLICIQVDDLAYSTANWPNKDATAGYSTDCSNFVLSTTAIPDPNFERALITLGYDSGEIDGVVYTHNISGITSLDVSKNSNTPDSEKISNLAGIEDFTALTRLDCDFNQLTELNISTNTALTALWCSFNQLTELDVSANTALTTLWCKLNQLTILNVSSNTALTDLNCNGSQLTNLDVSANTALTKLYCYSNQLTSLNVSSNTALTYLDCDGNQLTNLDVSANTALTGLDCSNNQLTSLDVSVNTALTYLVCHNNQLTSLNVKNGNNNNFTATYGDNRIANSFKATGNPNLGCIQVDDVAYSTANWPNKDATSSYNTVCTAPVIMTTTIAPTGETITMQTSEQVTLTNADNEDFTVTSTLNGVMTTHQVTGITSGSIVLTVSPAIPMGATVSVSYDPTLGSSTEAITDSGGNPMSSFTNIMTTTVLSNNTFKITVVSISPNPTSGILNITVDEKVEYKLLNIRGQTLKTGVLDTGDREINLSPFAKGIYLLNIKTSKGSFTEKIIKN